MFFEVCRPLFRYLLESNPVSAGTLVIGKKGGCTTIAQLDVAGQYCALPVRCRDQPPGGQRSMDVADDGAKNRDALDDDGSGDFG